MEEHRDKLDETSYQLMMEIQTGRMVSTSRPPRTWILVGLVSFVLGGLTGLLLAGGNRTSGTADSTQAMASTFRVHALQPQPKEPQDQADLLRRSFMPQGDTPLTHEPLEESPAAAIQPSSDSNTGSRTRSLSASPVPTRVPKPANARPPRVNKLKQEPSYLGQDQPQRIAQRRSMQPSSRSPASDFDPNADLVRSSE
jgi:hypothetical protein